MTKIITLASLLVLLIIGIVGVYSYSGTSYDVEIEEEESPQVQEDVLVILNHKVEAPEKRILVHEKFTGKIDKDANIVTIGSDGAIYNVQNGVVLADDNVISKDEESYSVHRINNKRFSQSSQ